MSPPQLVILPYDDLPPGSDLRREWGPEGLTVVAPAGDVPARARRAAAVGAMPAAAGTCGWLIIVVTVVGWMVFHDNLRRLGPAEWLWVGGLYATVGLGLFLLVWRGRTTDRLEALERARRQSTVLRVTPTRLLVETTGPLGAASHDVAAGRVRSIEVGGPPVGTPGAPEAAGTLLGLNVVLEGEDAVHLMPGRDEVELRWVAAALGKVLRPASD